MHPELIINFGVHNSTTGDRCEVKGRKVTVTMQFSEIWKGAFTVGVRCMRLSLNDVVVENDLDVFAGVGGNKLLPVTNNVIVAPDGFVVVRVESIVQNAMISGILIEDETTTPTTPLTSSSTTLPTPPPATPTASATISTSVAPINTNPLLVARPAGENNLNKHIQLNPDFLVRLDDISNDMNSLAISIECVKVTAG